MTLLDLLPPSSLDSEFSGGEFSKYRNDGFSDGDYRDSEFSVSTRRRLDAELVRRGLVASRALAVEAIAANRVLVDGAVAAKPARMVSAGDAIVLVGDGPRFVSRGGLKLQGALEYFRVDPAGLECLDVGASTGGFTDCLLQAGARRVIAVDVGIGQLHERLRADPRVEVHERLNVRTDALAQVLGTRSIPLIVGDLSFISLTSVAPSLMNALNSEGQLVLLVKPQFEAGRTEVSRGKGVVRNPQTWSTVLERVVGAYGDLGAVMIDVMRSPITGADGNVEFLVHLGRVGGASHDSDRVAELIRSIAFDEVEDGQVSDAG